MATLKEQGMDVEVVNWRSVVAGPGISPEQRKNLADTIEKTVKSKEWAEILKSRGWEDYYLPGDQFAAFLKAEQARVSDVLKSNFIALGEADGAGSDLLGALVHKVAAVLLVEENALGVQQAQGLIDGSPRDAEARGELLRGEMLSSAEVLPLV